MIYITGDTHGDWMGRLNTNTLINKLNRNDVRCYK